MRKLRALVSALAVTFAVAAPAAAQEKPAAPAAAPAPSAEADREAIRKTILDYCEGWYEGNGERMERALHPDLAKRVVRTQEGRSRLEQMSAMGLVQGTRSGFGKRTPPEQQQKDIVIYDVYENAAIARATMSGWIDYFHLARWNGQWVIVNVLWELKPKK